jgi:hypothetical protein
MNEEESAQQSETVISSAELQKLRLTHQRYETLRRMNVEQFKAAWSLNISTGKPFDQIIDELRPFMTNF